MNIRKGEIVNKKRPVHLDLTKISFPPMALVSIGHRISGVLMFLLLPLAIYLLRESLLSAEGFAHVQALYGAFFVRLALWALASATLFHLFAGIRHLIMDFGWGETVQQGRKTAYAVFILSAIMIVILGVWIW